MKGLRGCLAEKVITFRGTVVGEAEVQRIRTLIAQHRDRTQLQIARRVCHHFKWYRPNGDLADQAFVGVLRRLRARGALQLPAPRVGVRRETASSSTDLPELRWPDAELPSETRGTGELVVRPIHAYERVAWRQHIARCHYLGHRPLVGESLCYVAFLKGEVVALIGWAAAALKNTPRDAYIG